MPTTSDNPHDQQASSVISHPAVFFLTGMAIQNTILSPAQYTPWVIFRQLLCSLVLSYLPSYFDGSEFSTQGRPSLSMMQWAFWRWAFKGSKAIYTTPLDPSQQHIFCLHPHGVSSSSHWFLACIELMKQFPNKRHLGAEIIFKVPIYRDMMLGAGIVDAGKDNTEGILREGRNLVLLPGGLSEQVRAAYRQHTIYIKRRSGIFYYALKYNVPIVPIYSFNENELYYTSSFLQSVRNWINDTFWFPICLCFPARILPRGLHIYFGRPIHPHEVLSSSSSNGGEGSGTVAPGGAESSLSPLHPPSPPPPGPSQSSLQRGSESLIPPSNQPSSLQCRHNHPSDDDDAQHNSLGTGNERTPRDEDPLMKHVDQFRELYIAEIRRIFDQYKAEEGYPDAVLEVL